MAGSRQTTTACMMPSFRVPDNPLRPGGGPWPGSRVPIGPRSYQTDVPPVVPGARPVSVERVKIHGAALEGNLEGNAVDRDAIVFLPPSYAKEKSRRYPVVYALHGYSIGAEQWKGEIHVPQTIEGAFAQGAGEMIVVLPDSKTATGPSRIRPGRRGPVRRQPPAVPRHRDGRGRSGWLAHRRRQAARGSRQLRDRERLRGRADELLHSPSPGRPVKQMPWADTVRTQASRVAQVRMSFPQGGMLPRDDDCPVDADGAPAAG